MIRYTLERGWSNKKNIPMVVFRSLVGLVYRKSLQISSFSYPICSMYSIFTYIWVIFRVHVGEYTIHGASGHELVSSCGSPLSINQQQHKRPGKKRSKRPRGFMLTLDNPALHFSFATQQPLDIL